MDKLNASAAFNHARKKVDDIEALAPNAIGMKFVRIEPGTFMMGSPENEELRNPNETQHKVMLTKAFWMQTTPVTQSQWKAIMGTEPSKFQGEDLPVENVSWSDAVEFCRRLSVKEHKKHRLPTEAEWEYACRAGTTTRLNTGDDETALNEAAWWHGNSGRKTHPVGEKKPNAWGLYDMHGNIEQWCSDYYGEYSYVHNDPVGPKHSDFNQGDDPVWSSRVTRGGSWQDNLQYCRSAFRGRRPAGGHGELTGFRLCRDP